MYQDLAAALARAEADPAVRVILISGTGGNFTAGNDLADFLDQPPDSEDAPVFRFLNAFAGLQKPFVAAVDGIAIGVGTTILLHCDLVYAGASARFALPFANLGLTPEAASSLLLPLRAGHARAAEMLLLGEVFRTNGPRHRHRQCRIARRAGTGSRAGALPQARRSPSRRNPCA
jgi:enoyl-CoA hydratase/carnithine racemase